MKKSYDQMNLDVTNAAKDLDAAEQFKYQFVLDRLARHFAMLETKYGWGAENFNEFYPASTIEQAVREGWKMPRTVNKRKAKKIGNGVKLLVFILALAMLGCGEQSSAKESPSPLKINDRYTIDSYLYTPGKGSSYRIIIIQDSVTKTETIAISGVGMSQPLASK